MCYEKVIDTSMSTDVIECNGSRHNKSKLINQTHLAKNSFMSTVQHKPRLALHFHNYTTDNTIQSGTQNHWQWPPSAYRNRGVTVTHGW